MSSVMPSAAALDRITDVTISSVTLPSPTGISDPARAWTVAEYAVQA
ncbi:hypothetical protein ACQP1G_15800 [Nocardia sp. CA-107356]